MANIFTNEKVNNSIITMSNSATSVFIETLCVAGVAIANKAFEKDILIWLAQRDWILVGMGMEGFDIDEICWNKEKFADQKQFLLSVIDTVFERTNWNMLGYKPNEKFLFERLHDFKIMVSDFNIDCIDETTQIEIFDFNGTVKKYELCEEHNIYKHFHGCVICNNK